MSVDTYTCQRPLDTRQGDWEKRESTEQCKGTMRRGVLPTLHGWWKYVCDKCGREGWEPTG